jgi:hypothetical protein
MLQGPHTAIHQSNNPNSQVVKHNVRFGSKRICPPKLLSEQSLQLSHKVPHLLSTILNE